METVQVTSDVFYQNILDKKIHYAICNMEKNRWTLYVEGKDLPFEYSDVIVDPFNQGLSNIKEFKIPDNITPQSFIEWFIACHPAYLLYNNVLKTLVVYMELSSMYKVANFNEVVTVEVLREFDFDYRIYSYINTGKFIAWYMLESVAYVKMFVSDYQDFLDYEIFHNVVPPKTITFIANDTIDFNMIHLTAVRGNSNHTFPQNTLITNSQIVYSYDRQKL